MCGDAIPSIPYKQTVETRIVFSTDKQGHIGELHLGEVLIDSHGRTHRDLGGHEKQIVWLLKYVDGLGI